MSTDTDGQKRNMRAAVRQLVDRLLKRTGFAMARRGDAPDLTWEPDDHVCELPEQGGAVDPWECDGQFSQPAEFVQVLSERPAPDVGPHQDPSDVGCSVTADSGEDAAPHCHQAQQDLGLDLSTAEEPFDADELSVAAAAVASEDWSDLEEAEGECAQALDGLRTETRNEFRTDAVDRWEDRFYQNEAEVEVDYARTIDVPIPDLEFDAEESIAAESWLEMFPKGSDDSDFGIYDFDPEARQAPWDLDPGLNEVVPRRARERAAAVAALIDVANRREQAQVIAFLTALFEHLQHPATFHALIRVASEGLTPDLLYSMVALRHQWAERTDWWKGRYGHGFEVSMLPNGASALSWVQCARICRARADQPPEFMIDEEWLDDWLALAPGSPGFLSFPAYLNVKIDAVEASFLDSGLLLEQQRNGCSELGDDFGWYRRVAHDHDALRFGFQIRTPYDERAGQIRMVHE